jgi:WD40 repeat protein
MQDHQQSSQLRESVVDGHRFLLYFFDMIQTSVAHLYHSALPFAPKTRLWDMYRAEMKSVEARILQGRETEWTPLIRTVSLPMVGYVVRYSHDGRMLAVGGHDFSQLFWTGTGERLAELESNCGYVESISFSCDDRTLATVSRSTVRLWDVASGSLITTLAEDSAKIYCADFHPYIGHLLAAGDQGGRVFVWDMKDNTRHDFNVVGSKGRLCWVRQREQKRIIVGCEDGRMEMWDTDSLQQTQVFTSSQSDGWIRAVASSDDGSLVASGSDDGTLAVYSTHTGELLHSHKHNDRIHSVAFSPTAPVLAFASPDSKVFLWFYATDCTVTFTGHSSFVISVAFSPNGRFIASASDDATLRLHIGEANATNPAPDNIHHSKEIRRVHFSNDGQLIISASFDQTVKVWDTLTGTLRTTLIEDRDWVDDAIILPDNVHVVSRGLGGTLMVWDWQKGETLFTDTEILWDKYDVYTLFTYTHAFPPLGFISTHTDSYGSEERIVCCWTVDPSAPYHARGLVARGVVNTSYSDTILRITHRGSTETSNLTLTLECHSGKQFSALWDVSSSPAQLEFVEELEESPLEGTNQSLAGSELPCHRSDDILDKNNQQILWVPPANRGDKACWYDRHLVIGGHTGRLTLVDFSDVILNGNIEF